MMFLWKARHIISLLSAFESTLSILKLSSFTGNIYYGVTYTLNVFDAKGCHT